MERRARPGEWRVDCTRCHEESVARWEDPGSSLVEIVIGLFTLGGAAAFYRIYRESRSGWVCDVFQSPEIVPVGSKRAEEIRSRAAEVR